MSAAPPTGTDALGERPEAERQTRRELSKAGVLHALIEFRKPMLVAARGPREFEDGKADLIRNSFGLSALERDSSLDRDICLPLTPRSVSDMFRRTLHVTEIGGIAQLRDIERLPPASGGSRWA